MFELDDVDLSNKTGRYLWFTVKTFYGSGGGLQYLTVNIPVFNEGTDTLVAIIVGSVLILILLTVLIFAILKKCRICNNKVI